MKINSLYEPEVVTAEPTETLVDVARRMDWLGVSCLPVVERGRMVGIITERDITRAAAAGEDPHDVAAGAYMTHEPVTVGPEEDAEQVARVMHGLGLRHLPVVECGKVVGVISARDLLSLDFEPVRQMS